MLNQDDIDGYKIYLLMFTLALLQLRYTSFCLDKVRQGADGQKGDDGGRDSRTDKDGEKDKEEEMVLGFGLTDMIFYVFYVPLFFTGPIISYTVFSCQVRLVIRLPSTLPDYLEFECE